MRVEGFIVRVGSWLFAGLVVAMIATWTAPASANSAAPFSRPTGLAAGPMLERQSPVVVEREDLDITCSEIPKRHGASHARCDFVATYHLFNPTLNGEEILGAFYDTERQGESAAEVAAELDGADATAEASSEQLARMDVAASLDPQAREYLTNNQSTFRRKPFRISIGAGQRRKLVFRGELRALGYHEEGNYGGFVLPAMLARHPFVGRHNQWDWQSGTDQFLYLVSPLASWSGDPEVHIRIKHPARFSFDGAPGATRERSREPPNEVTERLTIRAKIKQNLWFELSDKPSTFFNGGPLIGIGPRFGRSELHVRFGYEFGIKDYLILGVVADTNFDRYVTPAITLDAITPNLLIIPSFSFGVGAVTQFRKDTDARVGIRTQIGIGLPLVSVSFPIDIYPAENSSGSHVEGAFLTQLTF